MGIADDAVVLDPAHGGSNGAGAPEVPEARQGGLVLAAGEEARRASAKTLSGPAARAKGSGRSGT